MEHDLSSLIIALNSWHKESDTLGDRFRRGGIGSRVEHHPITPILIDHINSALLTELEIDGWAAYHLLGARLRHEGRGIRVSKEKFLYTTEELINLYKSITGRHLTIRAQRGMRDALAFRLRDILMSAQTTMGMKEIGEIIVEYVSYQGLLFLCNPWLSTWNLKELSVERLRFWEDTVYLAYQESVIIDHLLHSWSLPDGFSDFKSNSLKVRGHPDSFQDQPWNQYKLTGICQEHLAEAYLNTSDMLLRKLLLDIFKGKLFKAKIIQIPSSVKQDIMDQIRKEKEPSKLEYLLDVFLRVDASVEQIITALESVSNVSTATSALLALASRDPRWSQLLLMHWLKFSTNLRSSFEASEPQIHLQAYLGTSGMFLPLHYVTHQRGG